MTRARLVPVPVAARLALLLLLPALGLPAEVEAQRRPTRGGPPTEMSRMEKALRARFAERVRRELGLSDAQHEELEEVAREYWSARAELAEHIRESRARTEEQAADLEADEALTLLGELIRLRMEEIELMRAEQERLLEFLTPVQVLRLMVLREELGARIRRLGRREPGESPRTGESHELPAGIGRRPAHRPTQSDRSGARTDLPIDETGRLGQV
ncbi:MAG: Spy/CpxP family protein refolding chaperone [Gemmatimonadetes bacterium]|nr:Spy/CpxP family protein refolding chaperone [Gemmatimonadota bacterium]